MGDLNRMRKKKATSLESYANAAYNEGITYGKKQSQEYVQAVKIGTIPPGYKKAGEK